MNKLFCHVDMYLPFTYVDSDKSDEAELFRKIAKWSRDLIKAIWGKPDEALDVEYWAKIIELLPLSLQDRKSVV